MNNATIQSLTDKELEDLIKKAQVEQMFGTGPGHRAVLVLGLAATAAGIGGVIHGALGNATPLEAQVTQYALVLAVLASVYDRVVKARLSRNLAALVAEDRRRNRR